ncbi:MAG: sulfotransferase domain-containing protein [Nocardioidaceae bacterium]
MTPRRYTSPDEDSGRWLDFPFRDGDIVISTRSKSGTTWMQMICALLVLQTPELPAPLPELSPWVDWLVEPYDDVLGRLAAQPHRRFVKTHTPLDGVVIDPRATYIVVSRDPLDLAVSLYHQGGNIDRERVAALTGQPVRPREARPGLRDWLLSWVDDDTDRFERMDGLRGVLAHLADAWARRAQPNVVLVHYDDLRTDLEGSMRARAGRLHIDVLPERWPELVQAATFEAMRAAAGSRAPDPGGVLKDPAAFFRSGTSGAGRALLSAPERAHYQDRAAALAPADLLEWLHRW